MQQGSIARVQGFHDLEGAEYQRFSDTLNRLITSFALHGYAMMDVPIVEGLELYLRKNGAQVLSRLYSFLDPERTEVALRPEFTASVIRAVAPLMGDGARPHRVAYAGPVFRCERGRQEEARQFTQAGVELLGDGSASADAEVVALACRAALAAGVPTIRLVLGHLGPLRALLAHLKVGTYAEGYLLDHLEHSYRGDDDDQTVRRRLGLQAQNGDPLLDDQALPEHLADAVRASSPEEARTLIRTMLDQMGLSLAGTTRTPDEIIDRVLLKARRHALPRVAGGREDLERALAFADQLSALRGRPEDVLPRAEKLLERYQVPTEALQELREVLGLLRLYELPGVSVELAPGMARGIAYYSGLIFEIYAGAAEVGSSQICGGGRYDGLALALTGSNSFPALGFSFAIEALLRSASAPRPHQPPRVGIQLCSIEQRSRAYRIAQFLREAGIVVTVREEPEPPEDYPLSTPERSGEAAWIVLHGPPDPARSPTLVFASDADESSLGNPLKDAVRRACRADSAPTLAGGRS
ncbi:MAG: ATP phosphoribosyltransferase regulatory subunit [Chloroflexota bacterium]